MRNKKPRCNTRKSIGAAKRRVGQAKRKSNGFKWRHYDIGPETHRHATNTEAIKAQKSLASFAKSLVVPTNRDIDRVHKSKGKARIITA